MRRKVQAEYSKYRILVLDDEIGVIDSLKVVLKRSGYIVDGETNPLKAVELLKNGEYHMLILDFLMTPIHGDKVVEMVREFNSELYILLLTGHKDLAPPVDTMRTLDIQGYCEKSNRFEQLTMMIESGIKTIGHLEEIRAKTKELECVYDKLQKHYYDTIDLIRMAVNTKDVYTRGHSDRVAYYAMKIAETMGCAEEDINILNVGCRFHDIGKIGTPDSVLLKTSKLTDDEYDEIKKHPNAGARILAHMPIFADIIPIVKYHHERIDGNGYPEGLAGNDIPMLVRIATVSDAFDAMTSSRAYRKKMDLDYAIAQLIAGKGIQFDETVVDVFVTLLEHFDDMEQEIETNMSTEVKQYYQHA
ncbi:MAG: HD domain-containing protein [Clostridiales Family XIII bacterium]|jgi:putative nucleotidyltransferase with HDIG domain|nr:HD domain-containing protein [Clostridiales Family XIII bacterium]